VAVEARLDLSRTAFRLHSSAAKRHGDVGPRGGGKRMLTTASRIVEGYFGGQDIREATDQYDAL